MTTDLATRAARLFTVGFFGQAVGGDLAALLARGVGGVVFFTRNVGTPEEVGNSIAEIRRAAGRPLLVSVDQEGGLVSRLKQGFTEVPSMRTLGATGDEGLAFDVGRLLGRELRAVGFDVNYAPVLDIDTNADNPVIGTRSLGRDPGLVTRLGIALARGIQSSGVAACVKHFPGHGDTRQDSHLELPRLPHALERLESVELVPFHAAVQSGVAAIMTAHVIFDAVDQSFPATMSQPVLSGILRERMGFDGMVISDDIEMKAIADNYDIEQVVVRGLNAGVDQFLCCHTAELAHRAIDAAIRAVEQGAVAEHRIFEANRRIAELTARFGSPPNHALALEDLRSAEHLNVIERVLRAAPGGLAETTVDPTEGIKPIRLSGRPKKVPG